ncbi:MAG: hypothetical protein LW832_10290 [Parachlamydia sp.]|nr:hypothetical protein [Parachlamydia sp.]
MRFLTSTGSQSGILYEGSCGGLVGKHLPLSFYSTPAYWSKYVGALPGNDLKVIDVFAPWTLTPLNNSLRSPGSDLQAERINAWNGANIYDAACWQIALGLHGKAYQDKDLLDMAENQTTLLTLGYDGNGDQAQDNANRATTQDNGVFSYHGIALKNPRQAYFFRMVPRSYVSEDPFLHDPDSIHHISIQGALPAPPTPFALGKVTWMDWKPITGENGWAFLIGPLQLERLKMKMEGRSFVALQAPGLQNAIDVLTAFQYMQSPIGALYYACGGSLGNQGDKPVNPYQVSVENNFSVLAGLKILKQTLLELAQGLPSLDAPSKEKIEATLQMIDVMLNGGKTAHGYETEGLLAFLKKYGFDKEKGVFLQGGLANQPGSPSWIPETGMHAVDVTTWGGAVTGQSLIDSWFGFGAAFSMWENVKSWGGYYGPDGTLWGVGYSDKDENGIHGDFKKGINSGEWTAGAINLVRCLISQYEKVSGDQAAVYVRSLKADHASLCKNFITLRSDNYATCPAYEEVRPKNYNALISLPAGTHAYLYASKRYMIPFGWFSNPIPSTTSTAWAIMLHYNYNPFHPDGSYE